MSFLLFYSLLDSFFDDPWYFSALLTRFGWIVNKKQLAWPQSTRWREVWEVAQSYHGQAKFDRIWLLGTPAQYFKDFRSGKTPTHLACECGKSSIILFVRRMGTKPRESVWIFNLFKRVKNSLECCLKFFNCYWHKLAEDFSGKPKSVESMPKVISDQFCLVAHYFSKKVLLFKRVQCRFNCSEQEKLSR